MELKTYKEFKQGGEKPPLIQKIEKEIEVEKPIYLLQHPDIEWVKDGLYKVNDKELELKDGCVEVDDEIKEILLSRGFIFLKEIKNEWVYN